MASNARRRTRITVATVALLAGVVAVPVANGAISEDGADVKGQGNHCTIDAGSGETRCFESLTEATGVPGSEKLVRASGDGTRSTKAGADAAPLASADDTQGEGNIMAATLFADTQYGGGSLTVKNAELCDGDADDVDFQIDLADEWKDKISAVQPWGNCTLNLYSEPGLGGDRDGPFDELTPDIGDALDDRTQSISFS